MECWHNYLENPQALHKANLLIEYLEVATNRVHNQLYPRKDLQDRFCSSLTSYSLEARDVLFRGSYRNHDGYLVTQLSVPAFCVTATFLNRDRVSNQWIQVAPAEETNIVAGPRYFQSARKHNKRLQIVSLTGMHDFKTKDLGCFTSGTYGGYLLEMRPDPTNSASVSDGAKPPVHVDYHAKLIHTGTGHFELFDIRYEVRATPASSSSTTAHSPSNARSSDPSYHPAERPSAAQPAQVLHIPSYGSQVAASPYYQGHARQKSEEYDFPYTY